MAKSSVNNAAIQNKSIILFVGRLAITLSLLFLILRSIDFQEFINAVWKADWKLLIAAILLQFGSSSLAAWRWFLMMRNMKFVGNFWFYWKSYYKGMFFNQALPTSIGGDAMRVLDVAGEGYRRRDALYGVVLDRIVGLAALLFLNLTAYGFISEVLPPVVLNLALVLALGAVTVFAVLWFGQKAKFRISARRLNILHAVSKRFHNAFSANSFSLIVSSLGVHLLSMVCIYCVGISLDIRFNFLTYLVLVPPAILLTVVPISVAGWGVREGALVAFFSIVGANRESVLAMSLLYGIILVLLSLPGFMVYLGNRR